MIKKISALALCAILMGCGTAVPADPTVSYETERVTIVEVNLPKRFHVDVRLENGSIVRGVARSKHCAHARYHAIIGSTFTIPVAVTQSGKRYPDYDALNGLICH